MGERSRGSPSGWGAGDHWAARRKRGSPSSTARRRAAASCATDGAGQGREGARGHSGRRGLGGTESSPALFILLVTSALTLSISVPACSYTDPERVMTGTTHRTRAETLDRARFPLAALTLHSAPRYPPTQLAPLPSERRAEAVAW